MIVDKTDGALNRQRGDDWEFDCLKYLINAGHKDIGTSRLWNERADKLGIDIVSQYDEVVFPFNISCKATSSLVNYPQLLDNLPRNEGIINTVLHRKYYRGEIKAEVAILYIDDFLQLIKK